MNLLRLQEELALMVRDSTLEDYYTDWLNDAILEIASDFELPDLKLKSPATLSTIDFTSASVTFETADNSINATDIGASITVGDNSTDVILVSGADESANNTKFTVTTASDDKLIVSETVTEEAAGNTVNITYNWLLDLPATYHKKVFKCRNSNGDRITVGRRIQTIEEIDYDHDETGDYVTNIAVEGDKIAIFPKAVDTLYLWFYRLPVDMSDNTDEPDGIPSAYHERVIIPKLIIKNSAILQDLTIQYPPEYFRKQYSEGLYGRRGGDVGMINYFAKSKGLKRHGGRDPLP